MSRPRTTAVINTLCCWGSCTLPTDGHPICERHLRKAWAIVQAELNETQRHAAAHLKDQE